MLKGRDKEDTDAKVDLLVTYWKAVAQHMPDWTMVLNRHKLAPELRQEKISSHSTVLRALGGLGLDLISAEGWEKKLADLEAIDWSKKNPEWEGVCVSANSVLSNRQARAATKARIKSKLGLVLSDSETRSLPSPAPAAAE